MKLNLSIIFILVLFSLNSFAQSISDIDLVVRETVMAKEVYNKNTGFTIQYDEIGRLKFEANVYPNKCFALISGYIFENNAEHANPTNKFLVCVYNDLSGELKGEILANETL